MNAPAHPTINFEVNLTLHSTEAFGPKTNLVNPHMLHPMRYQSDQDNAVAEQGNIVNTISSWLPGQLGENIKLKHGERFTLNGLKAIYVRDNYAEGYAPADRAWLKIV